MDNLPTQTLMRLLSEKLPPSLEKVLREQVKRRIRESLTEWSICALSQFGQIPAAHHKLLIEYLEAVERKEIRRLMINMPPGSAKSSYASVLFPAWIMARNMNINILAASHTAELAEQFSKKVQDKINEYKDYLQISLVNQAVGQWYTNNGCSYKASGVGGGIAGFRSDWAIVDDPVRSRKDADSATYRDTAYNWYQADLLTRLKPKGCVTIIATRWHEDDLSGRLLNDEGNKWTVLSLPAIAGVYDENNKLILDPLGRKPGEPLWADDEYGYGAELAGIREDKGERDWWSLYQQSPRPISGGLFKTEKIEYLEAIPSGIRMVRAWDLAATSEVGGRDPDWTVGALMGRTPQGSFVVADVVRLRGGPDDVEKAIINTASQDGRQVTVSLPQDPGQAGKTQTLYLTRKLAGYKVQSSVESGDKSTRAGPFSSQVNVGNVCFVKGLWNKAALDEMKIFPGGSHDDIVDAFSRAFELIYDTSAADAFAALAS